jgi:hypothetical protein
VHVLHSEAPEPPWNFPLVHAVQVVPRVLAWIVPAEQLWQAVIPFSLYVPARHESHVL